MPFASRRGPVRKHVTQVAPAARADFLDTDHSIARITNTPDMGLVIGLEETRPTRPRIKFRARSEKRQAAKAAGIDAVFVIVEKHATEGGFRAVLEQNASLGVAKTRSNLRTLRISWGLQVKVTHRDSSPGYRWKYVASQRRVCQPRMPLSDGIGRAKHRSRRSSTP